MATLRKVTITDQVDRRHLELEEARWLLSTTEKGAELFEMTGAERALVYRVAMETGLRAGELESLTKASFDLDENALVVSVKRAQTKNAKEATLDVTAATAAKLREHMTNMMPTAQVFRLPHDTAEMFRADMAIARAAWINDAATDKEKERREKSDFLAEFNDAGEQAVFHSLRHTRGVWLVEHQRAHPREVQALMRLGSMALVDRYTKSYRLRDRTLVERAPDLSLPETKKQVAAG